MEVRLAGGDFSSCFLRAWLADHVELPTCYAKNPHGIKMVYVITPASPNPAEKLVYVILVMFWKPQFKCNLIINFILNLFLFINYGK